MSLVHLGVIAGACFLLGMFFSGCETAIIATDRLRLRHRSNQGSKGAKLVIRYLENPEDFLSAVLVGTNLAVIGCTVTFTAITTEVYGTSGSSIATAVLVPLFLIFNELIPKGTFLYYADRASIASAYPLKVFSYILFPVIKGTSLAMDLVLQFLRLHAPVKKFRLTMEEIMFHLVDSEEAGLISKETVTLAARAARLKELHAKDVMMPINSVSMVEEGLSLSDYEAILSEEGFSRLPVYRGSREHIVGILSIHNLVKAGGPRAGRMDLETPYLVSEGDSIVKMLIHMKDYGYHMAIVLDGEKRAIGMVTLEDILEKLVGAIADEYH